MANGQVSATICENKDMLFSKQLVEFWSRWAEYNPFGDSQCRNLRPHSNDKTSIL